MIDVRAGHAVDVRDARVVERVVLEHGLAHRIRRWFDGDRPLLQTNARRLCADHARPSRSTSRRTGGVHHLLVETMPRRNLPMILGLVVVMVVVRRQCHVILQAQVQPEIGRSVTGVRGVAGAAGPAQKRGVGVMPRFGVVILKGVTTPLHGGL